MCVNGISLSGFTLGSSHRGSGWPRTAGPSVQAPRRAGRSTRQRRRSVAALQRRKLPHVPGMRCPDPPGALCGAHGAQPEKDPPILDLIPKKKQKRKEKKRNQLTLSHTKTHLSHTVPLQVRLSRSLIHNTRPARKRRQRWVLPEKAQQRSPRRGDIDSDNVSIAGQLGGGGERLV